MKGATPALILALALLLMGVGLVMVYSASSSKAGGEKRRALKKTDPEAYAEYASYHHSADLAKQAIYAALGLAVMLGLSAWDYQRLRRWAPAILLGSLGLLVLVFVPGIGHAAKGAYRWIKIGPAQMQPSELAKLGLIVFMAALLAHPKIDIRSFRRGLLPAGAVTALTCGLIFPEPDFGATAILGTAVFGLWFLAGMRWWHLTSMTLIGTPVALVLVMMEDYRRQRIFEWLSMVFSLETFDAAKLMGSHVGESLIGIGSGGLYGLGLGRSIQKYGFLPEAHTDFIFAVMGEEIGFIGSVMVIALFFALIVLGWSVALKASDEFGSYLAAGITILLALGVSLNLLVALGFLPPKGLALPFISYGGSSLICNCAAVGILINIAKYRESPGLRAPTRYYRKA